VTYYIINYQDITKGLSRAHLTTSLSGHFDYLENNAKVLALSILHITCFIQKHPIGSHLIEQFPPILEADSIMQHLFQTVFAAG